MNKIMIFSGGELGKGTGYIPLDGDYIICADGGLRHCISFGLKPDIVVGDFDSLDGYAGDNALKYKKEKDETDTQLAVRLALEKGIKEIVIFGALGGRQDHALANIYLLKEIVDSGANGVINDGKNVIRLINRDTVIKNTGKKYISVFPIFGKAVGVSLKGMKYRLDDHAFEEGDILGISNEFTGESGEISIKSGYLLVILSED